MSNDLDWKFVEPLFRAIQDAHHARLDDGGVAMVAKVDQEISRTQEFLRGAPTLTWTQRDMYFVLLALTVCWDLVIAALERQIITEEGAETTITITSTAAANLLLSVYPQWMDRKEEAA